MDYVTVVRWAWRTVIPICHPGQTHRNAPYRTWSICITASPSLLRQIVGHFEISKIKKWSKIETSHESRWIFTTKSPDYTHKRLAVIHSIVWQERAFSRLQKSVPPLGRSDVAHVSLMGWCGIMGYSLPITIGNAIPITGTKKSWYYLLCDFDLFVYRTWPRKKFE